MSKVISQEQAAQNAANLAREWFGPNPSVEQAASAFAAANRGFIVSTSPAKRPFGKKA